MTRIVVRLANFTPTGGEPLLTVSLEEPCQGGASEFPCTAADAAFARLADAPLSSDAVKFAGERLYEGLAVHPVVDQYLRTALQTAERLYPVLVEIKDAPAAEALPWEMLCSQGPEGEPAFLALDKRWSLARMVKPKTTANRIHTLTPPVRIAAVLSCLNIRAAGELRALREAVRSTGAENVRLLVVSGEEALIDGLQSEMDDGRAPEVEAAEMLPVDVSGLAGLLADFRPHVLHFFCHGSAKNTPHLALAKKENWDLPQETKPLFVEASSFRGFTRNQDDDRPWLVVLNCCEGAAVGDAADARSLALSLAQRGIAPAVVGMREPVTRATANTLTEALYTAMLREMAERVSGCARKDAQPVDWPLLMVAGRDRLAEAAETRQGIPRSEAAASTKEWTLPVLYVSNGEFELRVKTEDDALSRDAEADRSDRIQIVALEEVRDAINPELAPTTFRPRLDGRIAHLKVRLLGPQSESTGAREQLAGAGETPMTT